MIYGALPKDMGLIDLSPVEMMFWLYCPISTPAELEAVPANLKQFAPILDAVWADDPDRYESQYVYLTAKTLWVSGGYVGNRPGWHSDGFGGDDVNYIWSNRSPTEFLEDSFALPDNCDDAMAIMAERAARAAHVVTFPNKHLLKLSPEVIHRSPIDVEPGMRTFVKVSISRNRYNLVGNSANHLLREHWPLEPRDEERNHPVKEPTSHSTAA